MIWENQATRHRPSPTARSSFAPTGTSTASLMTDRLETPDVSHQNEPLIFSSCLGLAASLALLLSGAAAVQGDDWPQWRGPNRDGVWNETGIMELFPPDGLKISWRAPVGPGWSSPVVAQGRVYVTEVQKANPTAMERVLCFD